MSEAVDMARVAADEAREGVTAVIPAVAESFRTTLSKALDVMVEKTVIDQHEQTEKLDAAERGVLKFNLASAAELALSSVERALAKLDFENMASGVRANTSGVSFVRPDQVLSPFLNRTGDLLKTAGYNVQVLKYSSFDDGYRLSAIPEIGHDADAAARDLDREIERYGKAMIKLREAEAAEGRASARELWDKA